MLREFTNNLTRWDSVLFQYIFSWGNEKVILNRSLRCISWSANGYLYLPLGVYLYLTSPAAVYRPFLLSMAVAFPLERLLYHLLKQSLKRDRPCERIVDVEFRVRPPDRFSFPSGHTTSAFLMMTLLAGFFPALKIPALLWATTVGFARVYLGVHYPTDVLAGAILGIITARIGIWFVL